MRKILFFILVIISSMLGFSGNSWDGVWLSPRARFVSLNIFVNIIYDVNPILDPCRNDTQSAWRSATQAGVNIQPIPTYLSGFIDREYDQNALQGTMTRRFGEASFHEFQITGDFVIVNMLESNIIRNFGAFGLNGIEEEAIRMININGLRTIYGKDDIRYYDSNANNSVFFVQFFIRNTTEDYGGVSTGSGKGGIYLNPSTRIKIGGNYYPINDGTTQGAGGTDLSVLGSVIGDHELAHQLFGGNDFHIFGGNAANDNASMPYVGFQFGHSLISGSGAGLLSTNGYERLRMHWKHPSSPYYVCARNSSNTGFVISDIKKEDGSKTFILRDFVTYGDVVRIKLPYKDSDSASNQYIWLENHQVGRNDKLDFMQYSNIGSCRPTGKPGIYAYYQTGRDILSSENNDLVWYYNERDNLRMIPAEGYWNYDHRKGRNNICCVNVKPYNQYHVRGDSNPFCGNHDQETFFSVSGNETIISFSNLHHMDMKVIGNDTIKYFPAIGDNYDAFSTHRKINMSTNPSTCNAKVYYNCIKADRRGNETGKDFTTQAYRNNQTTYLTGLSIEMIPRADSSTFLVKVRWDDYDITNSANWTGQIALKEKAVLKSGNTIKLLQNKTVAQYVRDSQSGYFAKTSVFSCHDGSEFIQESGTNFIVDEKSTMVLKSGSTYTISSGATLTIKSGCKLIIEPCAHLIIKGTGKLDVNMVGGYEFQSGALISVDNDNNMFVPYPDPSKHTGASSVLSSLGLWSGNEVTTNRTVSSSLVATNNITVYPNVTLTINSNLSFMPNCGLIIMRGGKVVVNNATLSNHATCRTGYWNGVEVWGNQGSTTETYGTLTLTNATIENAEVAVLLAKRDQFAVNIDPTLNGINMSYSGGRVTAKNTNFINNNRAVEFYTYSKSNTSSFENCSFKITSSVPNAKESLVYMYSTNGVVFKGCNFSVADGAIPFGMKGLYTISSSYKLYPRCTHSAIEAASHTTPFCPNPALGNYSVFENLAYGIYSVGTSGNTPYNVRFTKFISNDRGIYSSGTDNIIITDCIIDVPENMLEMGGMVSSSTSNYGIYINGSTGYQIEGNNITGVVRSGSPSSAHRVGTYGIIINNSGGAANRVYNNDFNKLQVGAQAQGQNRNASTGVGLCFACNDFVNNAADIAVMASATSTSNSIAKYQYNKNDRPAANGFTFDTYIGHIWDMYNYSGGPYIDYKTFRENANGKKYIMTQYTRYISNNSGILQNNSNEFAQIDNIECPRTSYSLQPANLGAAQGESEIVVGRMKAAIDGGNTEQLITTIANATRDDFNELNESLLSISPYMSNEAAGTAVENEDAISNTMVRDLMVGNSHAARDPEVMSKVEARINPLPSYMYDQIDYAAVNGISALDRLGAELQSSLVDYTNIFNVVANNMLDNNSIAEWESLMEEAIDNDLRYGYAVYNALKGDIVKTNEIISTLGDLDDDYIDFISVMVSDSINYGRITEAGVNTLSAIAEKDSRVGVLASGLLNGLGYIDYEEPIYQIEDSSFKSSIDKPKRRIAENLADNLVLYPNPAKDYITVEYNAEGLGNDLVMTITDIDGKQVRTEKLNYVKDTKNIDIKRFVSGSYVMNILSEGKIVYSKKFIIK